MIMSRNCLNNFAWSGFVKTSAIMSSVGQCKNTLSPLAIRSLIKKYLTLICLDLCPADDWLFSSTCISLRISWKYSLVICLYPWASINNFVHIVCDKKSMAPNTSASMELLVLIFCLEDFVYTTPFPIMIALPVWLLISGWHAYDASTHVLVIDELSIEIVSGMSIVAFK